MISNDLAGVKVAQPRTYAERCKAASECCGALHMSIPLVVDGIDDAVGHAYSGMPDRLYLIDRAGRVAYKGGRGPFGFKPGELGQAVAMLLAEDTPTTTGAGRFPVPSNESARDRLPAAEVAPNSPLPGW